MHRRAFIQQSLAMAPLALSPSHWNTSRPITFGIVADIHKDLMFDADQRLHTFIEEANRKKADFIIQLGDFCFGIDVNKSFMQIWNAYPGPRFHVLGNHDMDKNSKQEMLRYLNMPAPYYSFKEKGIRGIVLDANFLYRNGEYQDYDHANFYVDGQYRTFVHPHQIDWLEDQLISSEEPVLIFSHQSLWHPEWGVKNRVTVQKVLEKYSDKIVCCMNGHNHIDYHRKINGINYLEINSMSYHWLQGQFKNYDRFPKERYEETPALANMAVYQDPLFAFATIYSDRLVLEGTQSSWITPSPAESGVPLSPEGSRVSPGISDYNLKFH